MPKSTTHKGPLGANLIKPVWLHANYVEPKAKSVVNILD